MSGIFSTFIAYLIVDPELRTRRLIVSFTVLGAFQFVIAMLLQEKFLLIIFFFMAIMLIVHILPNRALAVMVVAMGSMFVAAPGGFEAGMNHWIFLMLMLPVELIIIAVMHKLHPVIIYDPPLKMMYGPMNWFSSFQFALMMAIGLFIYQFFQLPFGDWLIYTMALIHMGGVFGGSALKRAGERVFSGPIGFYFAFLYMANFVWFYWGMAYLCGVFAIFGFYMSLRYSKYAIYMICLMLFLMLLYDMNQEQYSEYYMLNMLFSRIFNSAIGATLAILGEPQHDDTLAPEQIQELEYLKLRRLSQAPWCGCAVQK